MRHPSTELTRRIEDFRRGAVTRGELVDYLTQQVRYLEPADEVSRGEAGRYLWVEGGTPYTAGSFDEVDLAHNTGLLPRDIYNEVADILAARALRQGVE